MSAPATTRALFANLADDGHRAHRRRIMVGAFLSISLILALMIYGFDYYLLEVALRPFSPKHAALRSSGTIGLRLGFLGTLLFFGLYLYPIRKRWPWLARQGNTRHWLDVHILLGLTAPVVIAFHSSFKFRGLAGVAFWIMAAVALSGVVGRYLFAQIPRSLTAAELSLKEVEDLQAQLAQQLASQHELSAADLAPIFALPAAGQVQRIPALAALGWMLWLDLRRVWRIAALRRRVLPWRERFSTLAGLTHSDNPALEKTIGAARNRASLSKRILFLQRSQQVFHLWHVVHRPFSYSFSVLALIHIVVVMLIGIM